MLLGVLDLVEVQLDRLGEITQRLRVRAALAGHIDLKTLRHVPVFFLVYGSGEISRRIHVPSVASPRSFVCPTARDADRPEVPSGPPHTARWTAPLSRFVVQRDDDLRDLTGHGSATCRDRSVAHYGDSNVRRSAPTRRSAACPRPWAYFIGISTTVHTVRTA